MKVALSVEALTPILTGIGRYTWELACRLPVQQIQSVRFFHQNRWIEDPASLLQPAVVSEPARTVGKFFRAPSYYNEWKLRKTCRSLIFHGPNYFLPECAEIAVATVHDLSIFKFPETHPVARIKHFEREFRLSMSRAAHLLTDSEATRREVIEYLGWPESKITAIPLGVSGKFFQMGVKTQRRCLGRYGLIPGKYSLCVSTLEPRKKVDRLLLAYQLLPAAIRASYPLVLIGGSGWLSDGLRSEITRLTEKGWLRYLGFVPEADLPILYAGASAFFYPSMYEGFGLPVLEAMASGVPVVTSNTSSLPEVSCGAALLVDSDDVETLAVNLQRCLVDASWRGTAISRGLAAAKTFTWERCVARTLSIYEKLDHTRAV